MARFPYGNGYINEHDLAGYLIGYVMRSSTGVQAWRARLKVYPAEVLDCDEREDCGLWVRPGTRYRCCRDRPVVLAPVSAYGGCGWRWAAVLDVLRDGVVRGARRVGRLMRRDPGDIRKAPERRWPRGFVPAARAGRIPEVCETALYRAIRRGDLPAVKIHGRWFVSAQALERIFGLGRYVEEQLGGTAGPDEDGAA